MNQPTPQPPESTDGTKIDLCTVCGRLQPFTAGILANTPLGKICTCAIEQRAMDRFIRTLRLGATTGRVEGH